jgi:hypothetical protein
VGQITEDYGTLSTTFISYPDHPTHRNTTNATHLYIFTNTSSLTLPVRKTQRSIEVMDEESPQDYPLNDPFDEDSDFVDPIAYLEVTDYEGGENYRE